MDHHVFISSIAFRIESAWFYVPVLAQAIRHLQMREAPHNQSRGQVEGGSEICNSTSKNISNCHKGMLVLAFH